MAAPETTVYHILEARGAFLANSANVNSLDDQKRPAYKKAEFPRMVYHPDGKERQIEEGEIIATPLGPREVGVKLELIHEIAHNEKELGELLAAGWTLHPQGAGYVAAPEVSDLQAEVEKLRARLAELEDDA